MRLSVLFAKTQREVPSDADTVSHRLLLRAGMISQVAAGVYAYLPLGWRSLRKIEQIVREEMDRAGCQEIYMPALQPLELWQQSGRDSALGKTLFSIRDRRDHNLVLGPTHEEVVTELVIHNIRSYRELPVNIYQIQTKFRDEPRPRAGLVRGREFVMMDAYSFDTDAAGLDKSYDQMAEAYRRIFARCGLNTIVVEADSGAIGGKDSREFMLPAESGEDTIMTCPGCGYAANAEKAVFNKGAVKSDPPLPLEPVSTPGMQSIEQVAGFLHVPENQTLKAVFCVADGEFVFVVIRGDLPVNEIKLKNTLKAGDLRMATEAEVIEKGLVPGAASPVGVKGIRVIADESVTSGTNFVAGGNKPDTHLKNVNYGRDFTADIITDIALARAGDLCLKCGTSFTTTRGIELGHIFKLGTLYSQKLGAYYTDESGAARLTVMGCYGIGVSRTLAAAIEQYHDDKGIIWPVSIAPYHVSLCALYREGTKVEETAEKLYKDLRASGIEVLFDDRKESPGVKFNDADLFGIPLRVTVSPRTLEKQSAEVKWRSEKEARIVPLEGIVNTLQRMLAEKSGA